MKKLAMLLLPLSLISTSALADTKNFEGFSAGLNLNLISGGFQATSGATKLPLGGEDAQTVGIDLAYGYYPFDGSIFTVGFDADLSDAKVAAANIANVTGGHTTVKQKNRYGIYFAPGVAVTKDALLYGKLGYNKMKGTLSDNGGSTSLNFDGISFGVGAKVMVSKNGFVKVEANRYTYGSETLVDADGSRTDFKGSATVGTIGFGFKF